MSLPSWSGSSAETDSAITKELLHDVAHRNGFNIAPEDEVAYLAGLRSSYAIAQQVELLPDYIDPGLAAVETRAPRVFKRPESGDNGLNAWCHVFDLEAAKPTNHLLKGRSIAVKDTVAISQIPQTVGTSSQFVSNIPGAYSSSVIDAAIVQRLLQADATLKGTSTCENFSLSPLSCTSAFGPVQNPWDRSFITGGSSSGSAALVALRAARQAGQPGLENLGPDVEIAIGGDQGGSIRVPASHCGIHGLKPTFGLVPYTGITSLLSMIDHVGPLATNIEDLALSLSVLAGYDGLDPRMGPESPLRENVPLYHEELAAFTAEIKSLQAKDSNTPPKVLRVGLINEAFEIAGMSPEVAHTVRHAAEKHFKAIGAQVSEVSIPMHTLGPVIWTAAVRNQMASHAFGGRAPDLLEHDLPHLSLQWPPNQDMYDMVSKRNPAVILSILGETMLGDHFPLSAQKKAHRHVLELRAAYDQALQEFDVLVTPTCLMVAPPIPVDMLAGQGGNVEEILSLAAGSTNNTSPFNASGHPAVSVPCGWAVSKHDGVMLPVGMQIIGKRFDDLGVLKAAKLFELGGGRLGDRPS